MSEKNNHQFVLAGDQAVYLEQLYERYCQDPASVDPKWIPFFKEMDGGEPPPGMERGVTRWRDPITPPDRQENGVYLDSDTVVPAGISGLSRMGIHNLLNIYRRTGHLAAKLDPLGLTPRDRSSIDQVLANFRPEDRQMIVETDLPRMNRVQLGKLIDWLEETYCGTIGHEHYYLVNEERRSWLHDQVENASDYYPVDTYTKLHLFEKVFQADYFEKFLAKKYVGKKRFSLEGGESLVPMLDTIIERAGEYKMRNIVIGMAHRGRLNMLVNVLEKPASLIFAEFEENYNPTTEDYADVKYHLGYSNRKMTRSGNEIHLSLAFNPSHLEAVTPVVLGSVRARQELLEDKERSNVLPLLIHGDAAFMGQGVVAESLNLMNIPGFTTGGSIHIIVNNQIGFTTLPFESRSTRYATDLAKGFQIPIFHVNGDDPIAVYRTVMMAMAYRQEFHRDVIIDLICYRRLGHNETDEPAFTQPLMYDKIRKHPTTVKIYEKVLEQDSTIRKEDINYIKNGSMSGLEESFNKARENNITMKVDTMGGRWKAYLRKPLDSEPETKLLASQMQRVAEALTSLPENFAPNRKLKRFIGNRKKMFEGESAIDWAFAEALAFGSILENGHNIRFSGQDSERGTFSQRHAVLVDSGTSDKYVPLNHISDKQGYFEIINSPLSEFAVIGYEFGYSLADPDSMVIWEAQFGDFANTAQVIFDQFISSSEVKWKRMSGLTVLLPHGYEGQGPEHSSARIERFLNLCSKDNIRVCNCTTPAQYFHLLRRQALYPLKKPLVIFTPKSLLRLPAATSKLTDLSKGKFREVLHDRLVGEPEKVRRVIICSGKVYYDLLAEREEKRHTDVAFVRIEQLYPFPAESLKEALNRYPAANEFLFVQEEPQNQGPWYFVKTQTQHGILPRGRVLRFVGREGNSSPAAGLYKIHLDELRRILDTAFGPFEVIRKSGGEVQHALGEGKEA